MPYLNSTRIQPLSIQRLREYPKSARTLELPEPTTQGKVDVGVKRDGPFKLYYKTYGNGPVKILWLYGHGDKIACWNRYATYFGIEHGDIYTSLLVDHRGCGQSEGPWSYWTMKKLALDCLDLLDHLGWSDHDHSVNIVGHSMGGMTAQEIANARPNLPRSLFLLASPSHWLADLNLTDASKSVASLFVPKSADARLDETKAAMFGKTWLFQPDESGVFPSNGDNWAARYVVDADVPYRGAILQTPACIMHRVNPKDLRAIAQAVGDAGGKVIVVHGLSDTIVSINAADRLVQGLTGDTEAGKRYVEIIKLEDTGHNLIIERFEQLVQLIETEVLRNVSASD